MRRRWTVALVVPTFILSSCSSPADGLSGNSVESSSARSAQASKPSASSLDSAFREAESSFYLAYLGDKPAGDPLGQWRQEGERRLAACEDSACRREVESDLLNRLRFARGQMSDPVPGIPWSTGVFRIEEERILGGLSLLPLGGERILLQVSTSEADQVRWMCEGVLAQGRLGADGVAHLTTIHDEHIRFVLRTVNPRRIELVPLEEEFDRYHRLCGAGGTIFGYYDAAEPR
jgi:hypothetical protein